jgi:hypothetical protein
VTAQERLDFLDLRREVQDGFKEIRALNMDMIQRVARLEASAQTTQVSTHFRMIQVGVLISLAGTIWNVIHG